MHIRHLGLCDYVSTWQSMKRFTASRTPQTCDEIWLLEHPPVYTLGYAGKKEHLIADSSIPLVQIDRGGQIAYHGPGQIIAYTLFDIKRRKMGIHQFVSTLEQSVINLLSDYSIISHTRPKAPGVYVNAGKIAFFGLRVRHGHVYHGLALNVAMDLTPFSFINPCGYPGLAVTQLSDLGCHEPLGTVANALAQHMTDTFASSVLFRQF